MALAESEGQPHLIKGLDGVVRGPILVVIDADLPVLGSGGHCRSPLMNRLVRQELFDEQRRSRRGEPDAPATLRRIAR